MSSQDILNLYKLESDILDSQTTHRTFISDASRGIRRLEITETWHRDTSVGRGGFAHVYLEREEKGKLRAVKQIYKSFHQSQGYDYLREVLAMVLSSDKTFFPELFGWFEDDSNLYIAMEYFPLGDLSKCLSGPQAEADSRSIINQVAEALEVLQDKQITHRDIKPENIFVCRSAPQWWVKLGDFGISKRVQSDETSLHTSFNSGCYIAPEVYGENCDQDFYTSAVDIWSLGCVLFWLSTGKTPLSIWKQTLRGKATSRKDLQFARLGPKGLDLLQSCLSLEPEERPTPKQIALSAWIGESIQDVKDNVKEQSTTPLGDGSNALPPSLPQRRPVGMPPQQRLVSALNNDLDAEVSTTPSQTLQQPPLRPRPPEIKPDIATEASRVGILSDDLSSLSLAELVPASGWQTLFDDPDIEARAIARKKVEILITRGYKFPRQKYRSLHFAAEHGLTNLIDHLRTRGFNVHSKTNKGKTAIHFAARGGHTDMIDYLDSLGVNLKAVTVSGRTAIFEAASGGHIPMINHLCSLGLDLDTKDNFGGTAIFDAAYKGHITMVTHLCSLGLDVKALNTKGRTALFPAADGGYIHMIDHLCSLGLDLDTRDKSGHTAMFEAAYKGHIATVNHLCSLGLDPKARDNKGQTALFAAADGGHIAMIDHLCSLGLNAKSRDYDGGTAIHSAAFSGRISVIDHLCSMGVDVKAVDDIEHTAIFAAVDGNQIPTIDHLCSLGLDVRAKDDKGQTTVHWAALKGPVELIDHLISLGVNVKDKDKNGETAISTAADGGKMAVLEHLCSLGLDVKAKDDKGQTTIHWAAHGGHVELITHLCSLGVDPMAVDRDGQTAMHWAANRGHKDVIDHLSSLGLDPGLEDEYGDTPSHEAVTGGHDDLADYINTLIKQKVPMSLGSKRIALTERAKAKEAKSSAERKDKTGRNARVPSPTESADTSKVRELRGGYSFGEQTRAISPEPERPDRRKAREVKESTEDVEDADDFETNKPREGRKIGKREALRALFLS